MNITHKLAAAGWHLLASAGVAGLAAVLVYGVWYPHPYDAVAGGDGLFRLVVIVDVVMGPLLTLVVYNRAKPRGELWRDLSVVVALQLAALSYGLQTVHAARPIYLVYEVDRFRVVTAADVDPQELENAPPAWKTLPLSGVRVIGVREPRGPDDRLQAIESGLAGHDISLQPGWWQELGDGHRQQMLARGKNLVLLQARASEGQRVLMRKLLDDHGLQPAQMIALPLVGRHGDWSVLLTREDLRIVGYVPIDSF